MKLLFLSFVGIALFCGVVASRGQSTDFEMPQRGVRLSVTNIQISSKIPESRLSRLPRSLPVFRYVAKPCEFPVTTLQLLLDQSAFAGTNIASLLRTGTNQPTTKDMIRLISPDRLDYFIVTPSEGRVAIHTAERGREIPASDTIPGFRAIEERLFRLTEAFGIRTNELERTEDGQLFLRRREAETSKLGGAVKYKTRREVEICRAVAASPFNSISDDKLTMTLGVDGSLRKFDLKWPMMEPLATNRLFSISEILDQIKQGRVLSDVLNEYPKGGIAEIEITDIAIEYYVANVTGTNAEPPKATVYPIASMLALFKSKTGESEEAGLYAPIMDLK